MENMRISSQKSSAGTERRTPKRQRGLERVANLLDAAARTFAEKGYDAATMTEIAAESRSSIGSLYQFFPTKAAVAEALHIDRLERLNAMLAELAENLKGLSAPEIGERIFDRFSEFMQMFPEFAALAGRRDIPKERKAQSRAMLKKALAAILKRSNPPLADDAELLAAIVLEFLKISISAAGDTEADGRLVAELRAMLRRRLAEAAVTGRP